MKIKTLRIIVGSVAALGALDASAYTPCLTAWFLPSAYTVAYDDSGVRYIGDLPPGVTCGCTNQTSHIWISGQKKGTTAATLAASMLGKQIRFYLQDHLSDGYCRSYILEVKAD